MKRKELTGFIAIATILLIFALGCLNYSFFIGHTASFNMLYVGMVLGPTIESEGE